MSEQYGYKTPKYEHLIPGDFFEACNLHPCICTIGNDFDGNDEVSGISLVDGSGVFCSAIHCGVERLTFEEALRRRDRVLGTEQ